ncbi:glycoside hydrolase family 108 protein [Salinicola endophyticus]|nr:glycosyl hydrolase 108 family protein [Salinicola endophyticus]
MMTTTLKQRLIAEVIDREGGAVDHPADRGGPTRYGITEAVARADGYTGDMRDFPLAWAIRIYERRYWDSLALDSIQPVSETLVSYLFDYGVNSGPGRSGLELQMTLNALNDQQRLYPDVAEDGAVGSQTLAALDGYRRARGAEGVTVLAEAINGCRIAFCRELTRKRPTQEAFAYGWFRRVVGLTTQIAGPLSTQRAVTLYTEAAQ